MSIANTDNKGFLIAVVLVLALAVFSGSLRGKYSTGAAQYGDTDFGNNYGNSCQKECYAQLEICKEDARISRGQGGFTCAQDYKYCIRNYC